MSSIFYTLLRVFRKITKIAGYAKKLEMKLYKNVFFSMLLVPFLEGFHDVAFYAILTILIGATEPFGELLSYMLAWFCVAVFTLFLPICFYILWTSQLVSEKKDKEDKVAQEIANKKDKSGAEYEHKERIITKDMLSVLVSGVRTKTIA